jgi:predicted phosphodiesterase
VRSSLASLQSGLATNPLIQRRPSVFAVDDRSAQVSWPALPPGVLRLTARGGPEATVAHEGGPGALTIDGLPADTEVTLQLTVDGQRAARLEVRTDRRLDGAETDRFFTMSDLHLNRFQFGLRGGMHDRSGHAVPFPERAATAAVREAKGWGARAMFIKGDIVDHSEVAGWETARRCIGPEAVGIDAYYLGGNHEVNEWAMVGPISAARAVGIELVEGVRAIPRPGLTVVMVDTAVPVHHAGRVAEARTRDDMVVLLLHHQIQGAAVPTYFPPGIPRAEAMAFLRAVKRAGPLHLVSSGHTHRHRARVIEGVMCTEVGSPKDYPGTWAGYVATERGIRQIVRRVEDPSVLAWTHYTRHAAWGAWGVWSPGSLDQRCLTVRR